MQLCALDVPFAVKWPFPLRAINEILNTLLLLFLEKECEFLHAKESCNCDTTTI